MTLQSSLDPLWGGQVESVSVDIRTHSVQIIVNVVEFTKDSRYKIQCSGVLGFRHITDEAEEPWEYVELTSISATDRDGLLQLKIDLWSSSSTFDISCRNVEVIKLA